MDSFPQSPDSSALPRSLTKEKNLQHSQAVSTGRQSLTDDEDEQGGGDHEAEVPGGSPGIAKVHLLHVLLTPSAVLVLVVVVAEVIPHGVPSLFIDVRGQLHLHLTVLTLHILGQVEARVGPRLPIELQG